MKYYYGDHYKELVQVIDQKSANFISLAQKMSLTFSTETGLKISDSTDFRRLNHNLGRIQRSIAFKPTQALEHNIIAQISVLKVRLQITDIFSASKWKIFSNINSL